MISCSVLPSAVPDDQDATARETELLNGVGKVNEGMRCVSQQSRVGDLPESQHPIGVLQSFSQNSSHGATTTVTARLTRQNTVAHILSKKRQSINRNESLVQVVDHHGDGLGINFNLRASKEIDNDSSSAGVSLTRSRMTFDRLLHALKASTQIGRVLKFSALFSCVFLLGSFSMESACMGDRYPDFTGRLGDPSLWSENVVLCLHLANGVFYTVLALLCHVVSHRPGNLFEITRTSLDSRKRLTLACDLLTIPGLVAEFVHLSEKPALVPTAAQWIALLQVAKFWRIVLPGQVVSASTDTFFTGVVGLFSSLVMFVHVLTVLLVLVANLEDSWGEKSWVRTHFAEESSCFVLYSEVLYFTAVSVTSVGYGDYLTTPFERRLNSVLLLLSLLFTAKVCADLTWLTSLYNAWEAEQQAQQAQTSVALLHLQVPKTLSERVLAYQSFVFNVHRAENLDQPAFGGLSPNLNQELRLCAYRQLVLQAPFLREQPVKVIARVVSSLEDAIFLPADFVVRCGDTGRELIFIRRGEAGVFVTKDVAPIWGKSVEVKSCVAGDYFGELSMLTSKPRSAWIMAKTYLVVSKLQHHVVLNLNDEFPEAFTALVQSMVSTFDLQAKAAWPDIATAWRRKFGPGDIQDCFEWFCQQAPVDLNYSSMTDDDMVEELSAKAFEMGLKKLHIMDIDRMVLWAELDSDNSGYVDVDAFEAKMGSAESWWGDNPECPRDLASVGPARGFMMEGAVSSPISPTAKRLSKISSVDIQDCPAGKPSPRLSLACGQRQIEADIQNLSHKVAAMHSDMQSMKNMLHGLATSETLCGS